MDALKNLQATLRVVCQGPQARVNERKGLGAELLESPPSPAELQRVPEESFPYKTTVYFVSPTLCGLR